MHCRRGPVILDPGPRARPERAPANPAPGAPGVGAAGGASANKSAAQQLRERMLAGARASLLEL